MTAIAHKIIDSSGLHCPQPILRCRAGISGLRTGEVLHFISTDPDSHAELLNLIARGGHELIEYVAGAKASHYRIRVVAAPSKPVSDPGHRRGEMFAWLSPQPAVAF